MTLDRKILFLQSDWGGEYQILHTFINRVGIGYRVSCPHTHQQNGTVEHKHSHIVEVVLALLTHSSVPIWFWVDVFASACYLINRLPSKVIHDYTPLECLFGTKPDYSLLKIFGCACWPHLRPYNQCKLQFRSM